jgi:hypothetical protein
VSRPAAGERARRKANEGLYLLFEGWPKAFVSGTIRYIQRAPRPRKIERTERELPHLRDIGVILPRDAADWWKDAPDFGPGSEDRDWWKK